LHRLGQDRGLPRRRADVPSPLKRLRDRSNTTARLREAFDRAGEQYREFSSHGFCKAALTWLDESGTTARQAADQAGHARVSMTPDTYFGRGAGLPDAARLPAKPALARQTEKWVLSGSRSRSSTPQK